MAAGLGGLGLSPRSFWSMTPRELDAAITGRFGARHTSPSLSRAALDALMRAHPDPSDSKVAAP